MELTDKKRKTLLAVCGGAAVIVAVTLVVLVWLLLRGRAVPLDTLYISPIDAAVLSDGTVAVVDEERGEVHLVDPQKGKSVKRCALTAPLSGIAVGADDTLYVTGGEAAGMLYILDKELTQKGSVELGHTPVSPTLSPDGTKLYAANRMNGNVAVVDVASGRVESTVMDLREPMAVCAAPTGEVFAVSHLPSQASTADYVAAELHMLLPDGTEQTIALTDGTINARDMALSPDGKYLYIPHVLARYGYPTSQLDRGWINTNALSVVSVGERRLLGTVLLDEVDLGAANPWGVTLSDDGSRIVVTIAGTHEVEVIETAGLLERLGKAGEDNPADQFAFLDGVRQRVSLPGAGPRGIVASGNQFYVCQYFTGNVLRLDGDNGMAVSEYSLGEQPEANVLRRGEFLWNDGTACYQKWQSCASCHPSERVDGLNWDNLNDGIGNPKNTRSMLYSHRTPPVMITGIRDSAETAVRAGMRYIQFNSLDEESMNAIDEYLKSLSPVQSPYRNRDGSLTESAERGRALFESAEVGCATCHSGPLYTDLNAYDVGTIDPETDGFEDRPFDTPTLVEVWRTAPYLFNGKCESIYDLLTKFNPEDRHGRTSHLTEQELRDLEQYVLSIGAEGEIYGVERVLSKDADGGSVYAKLRPGTTIESVTVRKQTADEKSANVVFTLYDGAGNVLAEKKKNIGKLGMYETAVIPLDIAVPEDLAAGAYYQVRILDGATPLATDFVMKNAGKERKSE